MNDPQPPGGHGAPQAGPHGSATGGPSLVRMLQGWLHGRKEASLRETLEDLIEESHHDEAQPEAALSERQLLVNILKIREVTVQDVMVPRADIVALEAATPLDDVVALFTETQHSRLPVYRGTLDDVVGMIHIRDILPLCAQADGRFKLADVLRKILFVAPSLRVLDLLLEMRASRTHMALVVDEFGGIDGLVTIEDLVEEIVGEIEDEHDEDTPPGLAQRPDGSWDADARVDLDEFEQRFGVLFSPEEREDLDTLGGLVVSLAGRVPGRGELVRHPSGLEFEILEADPRRIRRLRLRNLPRTRAEEGGASPGTALNGGPSHG